MLVKSIKENDVAIQASASTAWVAKFKPSKRYGAGIPTVGKAIPKTGPKEWVLISGCTNHTWPIGSSL